MADEVQNGLDHKAAMEDERMAIRRTIGEILGRKQRLAPVDAGEIYRSMGGESEFTYRLFAETFGGPISSDPTVDTPLEEITQALSDVARKLATEGVPSKAGSAAQVTIIGEDSPPEARFSCTCIKIGTIKVGLRAREEDILAEVGPATWVLLVPEV